MHDDIKKLVEDRVSQRVEDILRTMRPNIERTVREEVVRSVLGIDPGPAPSHTVMDVPSMAVNEGPLSPEFVCEALDKTVSPVDSMRGIQRVCESRGWECIYCRREFDTQRGATNHSSSCSRRPSHQPPAAAPLNGSAYVETGVTGNVEVTGGTDAPAPATVTQKKARKARQGGVVHRKLRTCIAPDCKEPSKGPRFHYLCVTHRSAKPRDIERWQKAAREA